ncbi:hypothetical protein CEXT_376121 [Caerostris extrusa]|uniref:Uncharacterized protein n=1 Tax=Caerostris extrusa TaxID=172846 RepID=A0AAV4VBA5_CAEEX|nr:hypothetical protein CEXT_376121 [Caerostris extrusa]
MQVLTTHALRLDCRNNLNNPRTLHAVPSWMRNRRACSANVCFLSTKRLEERKLSLRWIFCSAGDRKIGGERFASSIIPPPRLLVKEACGTSLLVATKVALGVVPPLHFFWSEIVTFKAESVW